VSLIAAPYQSYVDQDLANCALSFRYQTTTTSMSAYDVHEGSYLVNQKRNETAVREHLSFYYKTTLVGCITTQFKHNNQKTGSRQYLASFSDIELGEASKNLGIECLLLSTALVQCYRSLGANLYLIEAKAANTQLNNTFYHYGFKAQQSSQDDQVTTWGNYCENHPESKEADFTNYLRQAVQYTNQKILQMVA